MNSIYQYNQALQDDIRSKTSAKIALLLLIEILFLPFVLLSTPISLLLLVGYCLYVGNINRERFTIWFILSLVIVSSILYGSTIIEYSEYIAENLKRGIQLLLLTFILTINDIEVDYFVKKLPKVILLWMLYVVICYLIFVINIDLYTNFVSSIYPTNEERFKANLFYNRFSFTFNDPNTFGYLLVFISIYAALFFKGFFKWVVIVFCLYFVVTTLSRGALIATGLASILFYKPKIKMNLYSSVIIIILITILILIFNNSYFAIFDIEIFADRELTNSSLHEDSRFAKWQMFFEQLNFRPVGTGYVMVSDSVYYRPHSDLIRIFSSYGWLALPLIITLVLHQANAFIVKFALVALLPFLLNSLIDSYHLLGFFAIACALLKIKAGMNLSHNQNEFR